jgi:hypothetical protein
VNFGFLIILPAIASIAVICFFSIEEAVLSVYLPTLLLLPDYVSFGVPPLDCNQYAMIPIGLAVGWRSICGRWRWSWLDLLVVGFVVWNFISDMHAVGFGDILGRIASPLTLVVFPYMAGKTVIEQSGRRIAFLRRFVFLVFVDCVVSCYEFRLGLNPFQEFFALFFPRSMWNIQLRWGFARASGPFGHSILMGTIVGIAIILHRYLMKMGSWERRFRLVPLAVAKGSVMLWALIAGSFMTLSRGPWIATVIGVILASCGPSPAYKRAFRKALITVAAGGFLIFLAGKTYLNQSEGGVVPEEESSAQYRAELVTRYQDVAMRHAFWGWGTSTWPQFRDMPSVDNAYLHMTLMHGITGAVLYGLLIAGSVVRLLGRALGEKDLGTSDRSLLFSLAGAGVIVGVSTMSVFLGGQLYPLLFLLLGWGEGGLESQRSPARAVPEPVHALWQPKFQFRNITA